MARAAKACDFAVIVTRLPSSFIAGSRCLGKIWTQFARILERMMGNISWPRTSALTGPLLLMALLPGCDAMNGARGDLGRMTTAKTTPAPARPAVSAARPEVFPETPTLTFHGTTYTSQYLVFSSVETATNNPSVNGGYTPLDTPTAQQQRLLAAEVDHGGGLLGTGASINDAIELPLIALADLLCIIERLAFAGRDQGGGQQRGAVQAQQLLQRPVLGDTQADGLALRVADPARHFLAGLEDEGVSPRRDRFEQAVLLVVDLGVGRNLRQIAT